MQRRRKAISALIICTRYLVFVRHGIAILHCLSSEICPIRLAGNLAKEVQALTAPPATPTSNLGRQGSRRSSYLTLRDG